MDTQLDNQFSFFYPIIEETQTDFEGRNHVHEVFCEGHILYGGRLICKESMEAVMNKAKARKKKILPRRTTKALCAVCLEGYRNNPDSAYYKYTHGAPVKVASIEKPLIGSGAQT